MNFLTVDPFSESIKMAILRLLNFLLFILLHID